jgi:hypothetical protein
MILPRPMDGYLEKALDAEAHARNTADLDLKARWLGIAFGYRELARFRQQTRDRVLPVPEHRPAASHISRHE